MRKLIFKPAAAGPKAERGVGDVKNLFAVGLRVPAVLQFLRIVTLRHFFQVSVLKIHTFDFLLCQMAGAVCDVESAFAGAVNQVRRRAQIIL